MMEKYNSLKDTQLHIDRVRELMKNIIIELEKRMKQHDASKLMTPEKEVFDVFTPKLKNTTYGSEEYKIFLKEMQIALNHHYTVNSHHPEHYREGINEMDLIDLIEMICDWKAATERHADGDIEKSLIINKGRFNISEQLISIFQNTVRRIFK